MLAVLARDYDWEVDVNEPIKSFPIPTPVRALPMTFHKLAAKQKVGLPVNGSDSEE